MEKRSRFEPFVGLLGVIGVFACVVGAGAGMAVVLVRLPAIADTKLELLFGTLQGVAVSLLFAIAALLINLTLMVRRAVRPQFLSPRSGPPHN